MIEPNDEFPWQGGDVEAWINHESPWINENLPALPENELKWPDGGKLPVIPDCDKPENN